MKKFLFPFFSGVFFLFILFQVFLVKNNESFSHEKSPKIIHKHFFDSSVHSTDPLDASDIYAERIALSIYDTLFEYRYLSRPYRLKPSLALDFPQVSSDFLTYTITLKEGIFFQDDPCFPGGKGRELVAEDFVYSLKRHFDNDSISSTSSWLLRDRIKGLDEWAGFASGHEVEGLKALNKTTIQVQLKEPFPQFVHSLTLAFTAIVPKEAVAFYGRAFAKHPVGSGAWILAALNSKKIILKKNPNYRKDEVEEIDLESAPFGVMSEFAKLKGKTLPLCDEIEIHCFASTYDGWLSFQNGDELDYIRLPRTMKGLSKIENLHGDFLSNYENKYSVYKEVSNEMQFFGFNMAHPDFGRRNDPYENRRNKALRQALRYAFQWETMVQRTYSGRGEVFPGVFPSVFGESLNFLSKESITYSAEKAKSLLKEYGWTAHNLPELIFTGVASISSQQEFELFRSFYTKIGYPEEKIKSVFYLSAQEMFGTLKASQHSSFGYITWYVDIPDPFDLLQLFYSANRAPGMNLLNYENKEFDALYVKISSLADSRERNDLIKKAVEIIIEDCPLISGFAPHNIHMWHKEFLLFPSKQTNYFKYIARKDSLN